MKKAVPTQQKIDEMFSLAAAGDQSALGWIYEQNKSLSKTANSRMSYLEKKGMETGAYMRAQYYLGEERGSDRFYTGKRGGLDSLQENMEQAAQFLRSQTSTVRGEQMRRDRIYDTLEENGYIEMPEDADERVRYKKEMDKFFKSDAFDEIKKTIGSAVIATASELVQTGYSVEDLMELYKEYEDSSDSDIFMVWDGWLEGKPHL